MAFSVAFYVLAFLSVYVQVFLLVTFLENRKKIVVRNGPVELAKYPGVTIIVPCWNEERTVYKTVRSLLGLNYPKEKLRIFLVDDGSSDGTLSVLSRFSKYPNLKIFHKENGGKHTALNLGIANTDTEFVGCLDADSVADKEALSRIMSYFERDPETMAVAPSILTVETNNPVQNAQRAEYSMSVYVKKVLSFLGAIHVTPGPLTIFRKKVFDELGMYRHAHNTEDMEMAYRMQKYGYKIEQCNDAFVYTNTPGTVGKLFRQRLRWIYGFINNTIDYRKVIFQKKYGNFALFTVPAGIISIFAVSLVFVKAVFGLVSFLADKVTQFQVVGLSMPDGIGPFDPFFINTKALVFVSLTLYFMVIVSIILGQKFTGNKRHLPLHTVYFFLMFGIVGPFWILKAVYNTVLLRKRPAWR